MSRDNRAWSSFQICVWDMEICEVIVRHTTRPQGAVRDLCEPSSTHGKGKKLHCKRPSQSAVLQKYLPIVSLQRSQLETLSSDPTEVDDFELCVPRSTHNKSTRYVLCGHYSYVLVVRQLYGGSFS